MLAKSNEAIALLARITASWNAQFSYSRVMYPMRGLLVNVQHSLYNYFINVAAKGLRQRFF